MSEACFHCGQTIVDGKCPSAPHGVKKHWTNEHFMDCRVHKINDPTEADCTCNKLSKQGSFKLAAKPMIEWLQKYGNPHSLVTIELDGAHFYSGEIGQPFEVQD